LTDSTFTKARIIDIDDKNIRRDLGNDTVVIVAGFQGVDEAGNITTLGRGGSDTSGVALAASLRADECQIYTDVDGVYTTDPRIVPEARKLERVTFEEMLEMASLGSKVLQIRSVEFAGKYKVKLRVLSSFEEEGQETDGTLITFEEDIKMEQPIISGIAFNRDEAKLTVLGVPDRPGIAYQILGPIADANIDVDVIIHSPCRAASLSARARSSTSRFALMLALGRSRVTITSARCRQSVSACVRIPALPARCFGCWPRKGSISR
jgi:aspartate kinase